ncbi:unnamed protein product [Plutella xylostella]|uniref:(diamondback moth) hypothetical protein n=1 Tax=Plutella xylostella TaxID=51655 RepID=A0A8S4FYK8_PLUXY|nr:unnamed protein product [Plutella xylostella]
MSGAGDSRLRVRSYRADYTFDSHCPALPSYASQDKVFETLGRDVVSTVRGGVSACVLAYGQSATGKTHTMIGSELQPGLLPRVCRALAEGGDMAVTVSFLEIYNERVHDLLSSEEPPRAPESAFHSLPRRRGNVRKDLRVREHPDRGAYVQNLRRVSVHDVEALLSLVSEGARRRRCAATRRNPASSRSHALLELCTSKATLHLADLAGSENASWEGSAGGRQKEGANINKSLVALSNVISALVSGRGRFVPYRGSALTWLLKDTFSAGASTFIIATVSPSASCYGESASTLRWAARARQLPPARAPVRSSQPSRTQLQATLTRLLDELATHHIRYIPETGNISYDDKHWNLVKNFSHENYIAKLEVEMNPSSVKADAQNSESTASSVASGSSDVLNTFDKKQMPSLTSVINKEMDNLFGPSLERTKSGSDLKVIAPMRAKRRQYRSQEVLPIDKTLLSDLAVQVNQALDPSSLMNESKSGKIESESTDVSRSNQSIPILYDNNQRAEIVASVTERLYSKLKKKEESAVAKMESMVDKKIMEPLSELRICTNARQRLMDISQKAMRNKRRIGIPAHTQTRKMITRVRDQGVDIQTDLQPYFIKERDTFIPYKDIATETVATTPRCKEIAVGPRCGSVTYRDSSTTTGAIVQYRNSFSMTDDLLKCEQCTQTVVVPPPRRRRSTFAKYLKSDFRRKSCVEITPPPVININISQAYQTDSESPSEDGAKSLPVTSQPTTSNSNNAPLVCMPPDLLNNHNALKNLNADDDEIKTDPVLNIMSDDTTDNCDGPPLEPEIHVFSVGHLNRSTTEEDFPDVDCPLPRVTPSPQPICNRNDIEEMILCNKNTYPYNIVLSPPHEKLNGKRSVKFQGVDAHSTNSISVASQTSSEWKSCYKIQSCSDLSSSEKDVQSNKSETAPDVNSTDSTDSTKVDKGFTFKNYSSVPQNKIFRKIGHYTPVYKHSITRNKTTRSKLYREFLGLDDEEHQLSQDSHSDSGDHSQEDFRQKRQFFENHFEQDYNDSFDRVERNLLKSGHRLEATVNKYEKYFTPEQPRSRNNYFNHSAQRPREYLQHLVQIRRQVVKGDSDINGTSTDSSSQKLY